MIAGLGILHYDSHVYDTNDCSLFICLICSVNSSDVIGEDVVIQHSCRYF